MKKIITMAVAALMATSVFAQETVKKVRVYEGSTVVYEQDYDKVDSVVFVDVAVPVQPTGQGALAGAFSVAKGKQVNFSQGNLQYQASTQTWRFAENQYDMIGADNSNISSTYAGWIDLFGWGTSGWNSGSNAYQPYSTSTSNSDYYPGGSYTNNLTGDYAKADWGVYNAISNGGNQAGQWRTLTYDEWYYLFYTRTNAENLCGQATVNDVHGYVLLPDGWTASAGLSFTASPNNWTTNVYTAKQWSQMEASGAVFLPCAGYRDGTDVGGVGSGGYYWSSSAYGENYARGVRFREDDTYVYYSRGLGRSVRLVQDFE